MVSFHKNTHISLDLQTSHIYLKWTFINVHFSKNLYFIKFSFFLTILYIFIIDSIML